MLDWLFNRKPNGYHDPHPGQNLIWVNNGRSKPVTVAHIHPEGNVHDHYLVTFFVDENHPETKQVEFVINGSRLSWNSDNYLRYPTILDQLLSLGQSSWRTYDGDPE
jgi:hypothetical protein